MSTEMKLLFFSLRLIFATTQPSRQDRSSTISVTIRKNRMPHSTLETVAPATIQ